jgi:hypothetical protein
MVLIGNLSRASSLVYGRKRRAVNSNPRQLSELPNECFPRSASYIEFGP